MADVVAFHSQVASIMEVLANAAVAEICKLADEGFALLRWEMNQREKENEELRRRISAMEKKELADAEEELPDSPLINKEKSQEELRRKENVGIEKERTMQSAPDGRQRNAFVDQQISTADSAEDVDDEPRSRHTIWEVSGMEAVLKAGPETEGVKWRPLHVASERRAELQTYERSSFLGSSSKLWAADGSCPADANLGGPGVRTEVQLAASTGTVATVDIKPDTMNVDSASIKLEVDVPPKWDSKMGTGEIHTPTKCYAEDGDAEELIASVCPPHTQTVARGSTTAALGSGAPHHPGWDDTAPSSVVLLPSENPQGMETLQRELICKHCGRSFSHLKEFEEHQGVHSRGKALSCIHCSKTFSQLCDLKVHLSAHAAKRPFPCVQCGKSFMSSRDLKVHQNVHTGERPFCCTTCGRSFSHPSNLKRHQKRSGSKKCVLYPVGGFS